MIKNRLLLCVTLPFLWPLRFVQALLGFPVDMVEFNREIFESWRWDPSKPEAQETES